MLTYCQLDEIKQRVYAGAPFTDIDAALLVDDDLAARSSLMLLHAEHAHLLAAARAAIAAARDGEPDPLGYVREHLAAGGQLPPEGTRPAQLLAAVARIGELCAAGEGGAAS